ncbi:hypothetical protein Pmani_012182 [Petrolisthes manimaculis]|uniref:Uncharacterized protein n=1 Tax=Petrolisthes manimaculis TaxID=1843537 RepID=A0AAE1PYM1_9EUCA|nr:hypothetical protein Pmani_012182 [Petrolisthes manimaculis]
MLLCSPRGYSQRVALFSLCHPVNSSPLSTVVAPIVRFIYLYLPFPHVMGGTDKPVRACSIRLSGPRQPAGVRHLTTICPERMPTAGVLTVLFADQIA